MNAILHKPALALLAAAFIASISRPCLAENSKPTTAEILAGWEDGIDETVLPSLFATGESRAEDLARICGGNDQEMRGKAYFVLYLIGDPAARTCAKGLKNDDMPAALALSDTLREEDFSNLESLFASERFSKNPACTGDDVPQIDESLSYQLILDGSPRSMSLLKRMAAVFKACTAEDLITSEVALNADGLEREARALSHGVVLNADTFENELRRSAFFIPLEFRSTAAVELLARNERNDRMLVEVSYRCGMKCGSGYYVVLKKNSAGTWDYVLITRAWIS